MKLLVSLICFLPLVAGASTFKVKGKASYCQNDLTEAFVAAKAMADQEADAICMHDYDGTRVAERVTEFRPDIDHSDCLIKVKARYRCVPQQVEPIGKGEPLPPVKGEPVPQQEPKTEPVPVPQEQVPVPQELPKQEPKVPKYF